MNKGALFFSVVNLAAALKPRGKDTVEEVTRIIWIILGAGVLAFVVFP